MNFSFVFFLIYFISYAYCQSKQEICEAEDIADTNIEKLTYSNSEPVGVRSGKVSVLNKVKVQSDNECVKNCCFNSNCTAVTLVRNICILFHCKTKRDCKAAQIAKLGQNIIYIILMNTAYKQKNLKSTGLRHKNKFDEDSQPCELSIEDNCPTNSVCKRIQENSRTGICVCMAGFVKDFSGCTKDKSEVLEEKTVKIVNNLTTVIPHVKVKKIRARNSTKNIIKKQLNSTVVAKITKPHILNIVANAGPDLHIKVTNPKLSVPLQIVSIRGSATNKEGVLQIKGINYAWKRDPNSLAVGSILNDSDHCNTLLLTSLLSGKYIFVLTVTDKNGLKSSDSVNIFATENEDNDSNNLVDILLDTDVFKFTEQDLINFSRRMGHIIEKNLPYNNCQVHVRSVTSNDENKVLLSFYAKSIDPNTKEVNVIPAGILEEKLKMKLTKHKFIFDYSISKLQSRVCYNNCGGHGKCCQHNHRCECNLPWLNNPWHERSTGFSNCDMHVMIIIVVCVVVIFMSVLLILTLKTLARKCKRGRFSKEKLRYKLLDNIES